MHYQWWFGSDATNVKDLGPYWNVLAGSFDILGSRFPQDGVARVRTGGGVRNVAVFARPCDSSDLYAKHYFSTLNAAAVGHSILRFTDPTLPYYVLLFDRDANTVTWKRQNLSGTIDDTIGGPTALTVDAGDGFISTIEGTGNSTTIRIWRNPAILDVYSATNVGGDTTPDVTFTDNPANPVDTGTYYGWGGTCTAANDIQGSDMYGGDCVMPLLETHRSDFTAKDGIVDQFSSGDDANITALIENGVGRATYLDVATGDHQGFVVLMADVATLVNSAGYLRISTNCLPGETAAAYFEVQSIEASGWQIKINTSGWELFSYTAARAVFTSRASAAGVVPGSIRWFRFTVSADGLTISGYTAPDADDQNGPGTWTAMTGSPFTIATLTPDFHPDRCNLAAILHSTAGIAGDRWIEVDGLNTTRWPVALLPGPPTPAKRYRTMV